MTGCPDCAGHGFLLAMVDGVRNGRRAGWTAKLPCDACGGTGSVTPELAAEIEASRRARTLERLDRMKPK